MSVLGFMVNFAGRFSLKAAMPSRTSGDAPIAKMPLESTLCASMGWSAPAMRQSIRRLSATATGEVLSAISRAMAMAVGRSCSGGTTLETRPPARASSAPKTRPE